MVKGEALVLPSSFIILHILHSSFHANQSCQGTRELGHHGKHTGALGVYWQQRDELLQKYAGKWVALVGGQVVACGDQMNKVAAEALRKTGSGLMYVNLVGGEDVVLRVRRAAQGRYDFAYTPLMPTLTASVRNVRGGEGTEVTFEDILGRDVINELSMTLCQNETKWNSSKRSASPSRCCRPASPSFEVPHQFPLP